jgi:hypothetical protein
MTYTPGFNLEQSRQEIANQRDSIKSRLRSVTVNRRAAQRVEPFPYVSCPAALLGKLAWTGRKKRNAAVVIACEALAESKPPAVTPLPNIKTATDELHRCFRAFNERYFGGVLAEPAITIQAAGKRQAYGWCSLVPFWHRPGAEGDGSEPDGHRYEINLSAEHMAREHYDILRTLLHEMVHLHNVHIGVQDVSRGGTYHNLRFKAACERDNMFYYDFDKPDKKIGWSAAKLTDETRAFIDTIGVSVSSFGLFRKVPEKAKKASNSYKLECPNCGAKVRASKPGLLIRCKPCDVDMEEI